MKKRNHLTPSEAAVVVAEWQRPKGERPTQEDLALRFNVASVTIRRALAEAGIIQLAGYMTKTDQSLLDFLEAQGLRNLSNLRKFVVKARTGNASK